MQYPPNPYQKDTLLRVTIGFIFFIALALLAATVQSR